jgi:Flp pilus assembly protein TadD
VLDAKCTGETDVPWNEQIAGCTKAIESGKYAGKDLARALIFRGKAYGQTGDMDRCLADIGEAIRLDPTNAFAVGARGDAYLVRKDYERALADYTKAASLEPNNALVSSSPVGWSISRQATSTAPWPTSSRRSGCSRP